MSLWWAMCGVPGEIIEFGSYRGATALTLALLGHIHNVRRLTILLDTFTGTPATNRYDASRSAGEFMPPTNQVGVIWQQAAALGILDQIEIQQGLFAESIRMLQSRNLHFAFVHIDANLYQSTLEACAFALPEHFLRAERSSSMITTARVIWCSPRHRPIPGGKRRETIPARLVIGRCCFSE